MMSSLLFVPLTKRIVDLEGIDNELEKPRPYCSCVRWVVSRPRIFVFDDCCSDRWTRSHDNKASRETLFCLDFSDVVLLFLTAVAAPIIHQDKVQEMILIDKNFAPCFVPCAMLTTIPRDLEIQTTVHVFGSRWCIFLRSFFPLL